ncbi:maleylpyruvate isomerase N-terminal domain-containing protein [Streptosporangium sp. KLBMP 9127]|nr:maleylpyruvate isomerase N-terminal domain-containing protein [Streptosporangium sp. KLBMP 9127]
MAPDIPHDQWQVTRASLKETGDRFAELVTAVRDPQTKVTAEWSVAETVAHVVTISSLYTSLIEPEAIAHPFPADEDRILATTVDTVAEMNELILRQYTERRPRQLAERLKADIDHLLRASEKLHPGKPVTWLGGAQVPVAGVLAHLVNELLIHGWDIARATGARWAMPPRDAALFFEVFIIGMTRLDIGTLLDNGGPPRDRRIAVEFRSRYTRPVMLVLRNGRVTVEEPGRADVRVTFEPVGLNLMLFGRISKARAALTGKVVVGGPRPWLLPAFLRTVRLPSNAHPRDEAART